MIHKSMRALLLSLILGIPGIYAQNESEKRPVHHILQIVDMQNGFMEGGELGIQKSGKAVVNIVKILQAICDGEIDSTNLTIIASQDWHPENFKGFLDVDGVLESNNGKNFPTPEAAAEHKHPRHCVAGTDGAEIVEPIRSLLKEIAQLKNGPRIAFVHKGKKADHDQTSMFYGDVVCINEQKVTDLTVADLYEDLISQGYILDQYSTGVALDICGTASLVQPVQVLGAKVIKSRVIFDAARGINHRKGLGELIAQHNVKPMTTDQFLAKLRANRSALKEEKRDPKKETYVDSSFGPSSVLPLNPSLVLPSEMEQQIRDFTLGS